MRKAMAMITCLFWFAAAAAETCLFIPPAGESETAEEDRVIMDLLRESFAADYGGEMVILKETADCTDPGCARSLGQGNHADKVLYGVVRRLGRKIILTGTLADVNSGTAQNVRETGLSIEDMEAVARRVAAALAKGTTSEAVATTENIIENEMDEPVRRKGMYMTGFSIGYMYPFNDSYEKVEASGGGIFSSDTGYVRTPVGRLVKINWPSWWEFRNNICMSTDLYMLLPAGFGGRLNFHFLFLKSDFTPFVTAGLGLEYIFNDWDLQELDDSRFQSGPSLETGLGMLLFRTHDIHAFIKSSYTLTMNSDRDSGMNYEMGVLYRPSGKTKTASSPVEKNGSSLLTAGCLWTGMATAGALAVTTLILDIIKSANNL